MYACKYCGKEYKKESTLGAHLCEPKRRHQQKNETGVQLGFKAYIRFYELTQGSAKLKTYEDFSSSPYYMAFVKFGRYLVAIRCINTSSFIDWLLKNNKKIDYWTKDAFYLEWMREYLKKENVKDALERALKEMQNLSDDDAKLNGEFNNYFRLASANRICQHIANGRISPWIVFNCASGVEFLDQLNQEQLNTIIEWIDPDYWQRKFKDYMADTEWTNHILEQAGL
tara:strand:- start:282 stop:962 length:681 start_codon:yes stop_codon:yes gene_type:complete